MFESLLSVLGPTVMVVLMAGAALFLLALVVVTVGCFLGLGTEVCRSIKGWFAHGHR